MKKIMFVITMILTIFLSSVTFASCNLDTYRWKWITSTDNFGLFLDTATIKSTGNFAQVWTCTYFPGSCELHSGEHYHYELMYISYSNNSTAFKAYVINNANGQVLDSYTYDYARYTPIVPGSIGETLAMEVRRFIRR